MIQIYRKKGWDLNPNDKIVNGYFISKHDDYTTYSSFYGVDVKCHSSVVYQGITYFKNREDLETTIRLIGEKQLKDLW